MDETIVKRTNRNPNCVLPIFDQIRDAIFHFDIRGKEPPAEARDGADEFPTPHFDNPLLVIPMVEAVRIDRTQFHHWN